MSLENKIKKIIKKITASTECGAPGFQRPRGKFQVPLGVWPIQGSRDAKPSDICSSCSSGASSAVCQCAEAYIDYDYYEFYCVSGGGFGDRIIPAVKQLPSHCPSFRDLGMRGRISNWPGATDEPLVEVISGYASFIFDATRKYPVTGENPDVDLMPNILGKTGITMPPFSRPTTMSDWESFWSRRSDLIEHAHGRWTKMLFDARCGISAVVATGACCIPCADGGELGGRRCTSQTQTACEAAGGIFKGGECGNPDPCGGCGKEGGVAVEGIPVNKNVMTTDFSTGPVLTTQLSTALIRSLRAGSFKR